MFEGSGGEGGGVIGNIGNIAPALRLQCSPLCAATAKLLECVGPTVFPILAHFLPHTMRPENMYFVHLNI